MCRIRKEDNRLVNQPEILEAASGPVPGAAGGTAAGNWSRCTPVTPRVYACGRGDDATAGRLDGEDASMTNMPDVDRNCRSRTSALSRRGLMRLAGGAASLAALGGPAADRGLSAARPAARQDPAAGQVLTDQLGREYLAYPETSGTIDFSNCWGGARIPLIESWIEEFRAVYPNIEVRSSLADCPALRDQQVAAIAGGSPPNVLMVKSDTTAFFADQGALRPLDDLMERDGIRADWFYPSEFQSRTWEGQTYGLPNVTAGALHMLFVNTKLLDQVGWDVTKPVATWQDLEALVEPAKAQGLFVLDPAKVSVGMTGHMVLTYANGGRYWDDELTQVLWNEPAAVEAAEWMVNFVKMQAGNYQNLAIAADRQNVIQTEDWAPEKYVAMINLSSQFFQLEERAPQIEYATYTFPRNANNPDSEGRTPITGGWMFSIAQAGEDQEAAWEWIKFTTVSKHACTFAKEQVRPAPLLDCNQDPELASSNPFWPVVLQDLETNVSVPTPPIQPQFLQLWYDMEDSLLFEEASPKEVLDRFAEEGQRMLDDWNASS